MPCQEENWEAQVEGVHVKQPKGYFQTLWHHAEDICGESELQAHAQRLPRNQLASGKQLYCDSIVLCILYDLLLFSPFSVYSTVFI